MRAAWNSLLVACGLRTVQREKRIAARRVTGWSVRFEIDGNAADGGDTIGYFKTKRDARHASATQPGGGADPVACYGKTRGAQ